MQLLLAPQVIKRLRRELRRAGQREIGGLLMGEHVQGTLFRVIDISVQRTGGTEACFIRRPSDHREELEKFFVKTGKNYVRFNYLGEWHSHPNFEPIPSDPDIRSMESIVADPGVGANFLVLLICRLTIRETIQATAMAFREKTASQEVPVIFETGIQEQRSAVRQFFCRFLGL